MDRSQKATAVAIAAFLVAFAVSCVGWKWYRAGVQQGVYERQGVTMSRWEVFIGAQPVERYVSGEKATP